MNLTFRTSTCTGHLHCKNQDCEYIAHIHRTSPVNEMEWDGFTPMTFSVRQAAPDGSSLVCKICKVPPDLYCNMWCQDLLCIWICMHLGLHKHPVKAGENHEFKSRMRTLIGE
jgi:hypothetical protein